MKKHSRGSRQSGELPQTGISRPPRYSMYYFRFNCISTVWDYSALSSALPRNQKPHVFTGFRSPLSYSIDHMTDLKSGGSNIPCGFEPRLGQIFAPTLPTPKCHKRNLCAISRKFLLMLVVEKIVGLFPPANSSFGRELCDFGPHHT